MEASPTYRTPPRARLRALYEFMAPRKFVAGRSELLAAGFTESQIYNWCRTDRLVQVARSVYSFGRDIETREAALRAALLVAGPGAVLTGRTACEQWGIIEPQKAIPGEIQVAIERGRARTCRGISPAFRKTRIQIVRRQPEPGDSLEANGLRVASVVPAIIEFAAVASPRDLKFAFLEACRLRLFQAKEVKACFEQMAGRRGAKKIRPLLALWVPELNRIRSVFEGLFLLVWVKRRYPMPLVNVKIHGKEVDFYWVGLRFVLELDGRAFHSDPIRMASDLKKQRLLESFGEIVKRLTYSEFDADPEGRVDQIAAQLGYLEG